MSGAGGGGTAAETRLIAACALVLLVVLAGFLLKVLAFVFIPLSIALLCSYALGLPLAWLEKLPGPGWLRITIALLAAAGGLFLLARLLQANLAAFADQWPLFREKFWGYLESLLRFSGLTRQEVQAVINVLLEGVRAGRGLESMSVAMQKVGGFLAGLLGTGFWVLLFLLFLLAERESFSRRLAAALGEERARRVSGTLGRIHRAVQHYLGLKTLVSIVTGLLTGTALWLLGVPFAFLWGLLTFLLNFIPNIGSLVAVLPPVAMALFASASWGRAMVVLGVLAVIQAGVGNFLEPKLMGRGLHLSPLVVLLSLVIWGWLWGVVGMLVAVPLTAALKISLEQVESTRPIALLLSSDGKPGRM